jgi:2-polyprenyl-3-methyl-5-hydroxy-6-metoxy-1,4-benzoquinol methylase
MIATDKDFLAPYYRLIDLGHIQKGGLKSSMGDPYQIKRFEMMLDTVRGKRTILDVGCEMGYSSWCIAKDNPDSRVVGLDCVPEFVQYAQQNHISDNLVYLLGDGELTKFVSGKFDGAVLGEVLEHTPNPRQLLSEVSRVCKPKSPIFISVPANPDTINHCTHLRYFTLDDLLELLVEYMEIGPTVSNGHFHMVSGKLF